MVTYHTPPPQSRSGPAYLSTHSLIDKSIFSSFFPFILSFVAFSEVGSFCFWCCTKQTLRMHTFVPVQG